MRRVAVAAGTVTGATLLTTCSLLVDSTGLVGGARRDGGAVADVVVVEAGERQPRFAEDWEDGGGRWIPEPAIARESCSTSFQRETILAGGGRVGLARFLPVRPGERLCLVAWIRGSANTQPFLGLRNGADGGRHWLFGRAGYDNGYDASAVAVVSDGAWHWYAAPFVVDDGVTEIDIRDELYEQGEAGAVDFDDIRLYEGDCPTVPTGAPHACP